MSGKIARRLRRIAEQATTGQKGSTTIPATDTASYKEHKVQSNRRNQATPVVATTIRTQRNSPRAFYQEVKKAYKDGSGAAEAKQIQRDYRIEQKVRAKEIADKITDIVESGRFPKQEKTIEPLVWLKNFVEWLVDTEEPLAQALPFQVLSTHTSVDAGYFTITGLVRETQNGVMFVISSAGWIRAYNGTVINYLEEDRAKICEILGATLLPFKEIKTMEILDA